MGSSASSSYQSRGRLVSWPPTLMQGQGGLIQVKHINTSNMFSSVLQYLNWSGSFHTAAGLYSAQSKVEVELTRPVGTLQLVATVEQEDGLLLGSPQVPEHEQGGAGEDPLDQNHPDQIEVGDFFSCSDDQMWEISTSRSLSGQSIGDHNEGPDHENIIIFTGHHEKHCVQGGWSTRIQCS